MQKYKTYIAIDDTDEIGYYTSTGEICEEIKEHIALHYAPTTPITRHQLFLHEDIPYTSHNSSMCFTTELSRDELEDLKLFIMDYVMMKSAPSSAPGICIGFEEDIKEKENLIAYGLDAKQKLLTKESAYLMAKEQNLFLTELRGDGAGVVGALSGVALRMYGSDGRTKGKITLNEKSMSIVELLSLGLFDEVRLKNGELADKKNLIVVKEYLKGVYLNHKFVLLVEEYGGFYVPLRKEKLLEF